MQVLGWSLWSRECSWSRCRCGSIARISISGDKNVGTTYVPVLVLVLALVLMPAVPSGLSLMERVSSISFALEGSIVKILSSRKSLQPFHSVSDM